MIIILNGPPLSGKDTIAAHLNDRVGFHHLAFKDRLRDICIALAGITPVDWHYLTKRENKEQPSTQLFGLSPRAFQIMVSEKMVKPHLSSYYFGEALAHAANRIPTSEVIVVSDGGFDEELSALVTHCDHEVRVVRLKREGCTFDGDSRNYVDLNDDIVPTHRKVNFNNDCTVDEIGSRIWHWVTGQ